MTMKPITQYNINEKLWYFYIPIIFNIYNKIKYIKIIINKNKIHILGMLFILLEINVNVFEM